MKRRILCLSPISIVLKTYLKGVYNSVDNLISVCEIAHFNGKTSQLKNTRLLLAYNLPVMTGVTLFQFSILSTDTMDLFRYRTNPINIFGISVSNRISSPVVGWTNASTRA